MRGVDGPAGGGGAGWRPQGHKAQGRRKRRHTPQTALSATTLKHSNRVKGQPTRIYHLHGVERTVAEGSHRDTHTHDRSNACCEIPEVQTELQCTKRAGMQGSVGQRPRLRAAPRFTSKLHATSLPTTGGCSEVSSGASARSCAACACSASSSETAVLRLHPRQPSKGN